MQGDTILYDRQAVVKPFKAPNPMVFKTPQPYTMPGNGNGVTLNFGQDEALVVINGVKYAKGQQIKLPAGHQVTSITTLDDKQGKDKYGNEGKKGVIEITSAPGHDDDIFANVGPNGFNGNFAYISPSPMFPDMDVPPLRIFTDVDRIHFDANFLKILRLKLKKGLCKRLRKHKRIWTRYGL